MDNAWPAPASNGVQTNCWKLETVLGILSYVIQIITNLASGSIGGAFNQVINLILFIMYQYHTYSFTIEITDELVHIKGGPCQWCAECNTKESNFRCCSASWCFSSQLNKSDIVAVERRVANLWPDYFPRGYCGPAIWCCCHKSYNGWYFPWCCECCQGVNCMGCCDGDKYPVCGAEYVTFHLSESPTACLFPQRWTPNIWSACTYNRVSYVLRDPSIVDQLKQCGYQVVELSGGNQGGGGNSGSDGQQATGNGETNATAPGA